VIAAAKWWADALRDPGIDNGETDPMAIGIALMAKSSIPRPSPEQLEAFRAALEVRLEEMLNARPEDWEEAKKERMHGSIFRCVGVDYGPDEILARAGEDAGFATVTLWPWKTYMWINPGDVHVSAGYRLARDPPPEQLFPVAEPASGCWPGPVSRGPPRGRPRLPGCSSGGEGHLGGGLLCCAARGDDRPGDGLGAHPSRRETS
jgi:hypothetical protein